MCLNLGAIVARHLPAAILAAALALCGPAIPGDSGAAAGVLKNSVRVGDRSAMTLARPPKAGQRRLPAPVRQAARPPAPPESQAWFWSLNRPSDPPDAGRWATALQTLRVRRAQGGALAAESRLRDIAARFDAQIAAAARAYGVSESLLLAVIAVESAGRERAVSGKGAQGLMQLIPATARRFGVADSFDPGQNIQGGAAYLDWLLKQFSEDVILALAGYNAGEGAVERHKGVPPYAETRDYVVRVLDALAAAEALCAAAPDGPRRPCDWRARL
jgi:soluble lytic murein transglycosylase-like protein